MKQSSFIEQRLSHTCLSIASFSVVAADVMVALCATQPPERYTVLEKKPYSHQTDEMMRPEI